MQFAPLFIAFDKGYFKDEGLDINLVTVTAGQDVLALTAAGQFDGMVAGMGVNFFNALARGLELKFIAPLSLSPADVSQKPTSALMVRKELVDSGAVKTVEDLRGKKFGLAGGPGSIASYQVHFELAPHGMSLKDVDIVNLDIPSQVVALKNGSIDASMPPEPYMTQILLDGSGVMFGDRLPLDFTSSGVVFGPNIVKNNRPAGEAFMRAILRAIRDIQGDDFYKPENMAIFAKYTLLPVDTLQKIARFNYPPNLESHEDRDIQSMQQVFMEEGFASYKDPLPVSEMLDTSFVDAAVARLGRYQPSR